MYNFIICAYGRFTGEFWEGKVLHSSMEMWVAQQAQRYLYYAVTYFVTCSSKYMKLKNSESVIIFFVIAHGSDSQIQYNSLVLHFFTI